MKEIKSTNTPNDLIRRQDAVKQFCNDCKGLDEPCEHHILCHTMKVLNSLPSADPKKGECKDCIWDECNYNKVDWDSEQNAGEWLEVEVFPEVYDIEGAKTWGSKMQCDQCGFRHMAIEGHMAQYHFCPNCGAKMEGGDDE